MDEDPMEAIFSREQWREIDHHLFAGRRISAIMSILDFGKPALGLGKAREIMYDRYADLSSKCPDQFAEDENTFWENWETE